MHRELIKICQLAAFLILIFYPFSLVNAETAAALVKQSNQKSVLSNCATAKKNNQRDDAQSLEPIIRSWGDEIPFSIIPDIEACLSFAQGRKIVYSYEGSFVPVFTVNEKKAWSRKLSDLVLKTEGECRSENDGVLLVPHNAVEYHDVTGDGIPEEFLIRGRLNCSSGSSLWSGSGGTWTSIIVGETVTTFLARGFFVDTSIFNIPIVLLSVHGSSCGTVGVRPCIKTLVWDEWEFLTPD